MVVWLPAQVETGNGEKLLRWGNWQRPFPNLPKDPCGTGSGTCIFTNTAVVGRRLGCGSLIDTALNFRIARNVKTRIYNIL